MDLKEKNLPPADLFHGERPTNSGSLIVGDKGILYSPNDYGSRWKVYADGKWKNTNELDMPEPYIPRNGRGDGGMKEEWVRAIREGKPEIAVSNFEYSANLTEAILLGNLAMRAGASSPGTPRSLRLEARMPSSMCPKSTVKAGKWSARPNDASL